MFIFTFETVYVSRSFTISNVTKNKFAIDFNGSFLKKKIFGGHKVLFVGATDTPPPPFWTSGDLFSGFQSQSGQPYLRLAEAYMLHVPWDSPLVGHLLTSWQPSWQLSQSLPHTCDQALVGLEWETYHVRGSTDWAMPARLSVEVWVIFMVWLLIINVMVNVSETYINILK